MFFSPFAVGVKPVGPAVFVSERFRTVGRATCTLIGGVIAALAARAIVQDESPGRPRNWDTQHIASFVLPLVIYAVGGVLLVISVPAGLLVVAVATIVALVGAVVFSWVALVEILR